MAENSVFSRAAGFLGLMLSLVYLINPGAGVFELLPDNIPGIGNLDEATAVAVLLWSWAQLRDRPVVIGGKKSHTPREKKHD